MALNRKLKNALVLAIKLSVAAGLLAWLLLSGKLEPRKIGQAIYSRPLWLLGALLIYNVCVFLTSNRWRMLLLSQDLHPTRRECLQMTYIGCFFSCFLPGGTGGDFVKAYYVARDSHKRAESVTTVFLDRVLGLYCMVGLAAVAILFRFNHLWDAAGPPVAPLGINLGLNLAQMVAVGVLAGFAAATLGFLVFLSAHCRRLVHFLLDHLPERFGSVLKRIYEAVYLYRDHKWVLAKFALYSVSAHGLAAVCLWLVGLSLNDPIAWDGARALTYLFLIPLGLVLNGLPIAPAGVGVFEWALGFLFATVLLASEANLGASVAALGHVIIILTNQIGLIVYLRGKKRVAEAMKQADRDAELDLSPEPAADA